MRTYDNNDIKKMLDVIDEMKFYSFTFAVTPEQMKMLERESDRLGVSYEMLMENAGKKLAICIKDTVEPWEKRIKEQKHIVFFCGNGNNAGDCFVAARHLKEMGRDSTIFLLCGEPKSELAKLNFQRLNGIRIIRNEEEMLSILDEQKRQLYTVDGVFGTGFHGELPENVKRIFGRAKCRGVTVDLAVDVPSGGNCDTGTVAEGTPEAAATITFGCVKSGMTQYPLRLNCSTTKIYDIGIPDELFKLIDYPIIYGSYIDCTIPKRDDKYNSNKGDFGRLLCVCGSENMPGAALLSACAAARSGVGLLEVCAPKAYVPHFAAKLPEAIYLPLETSENTYTAESYEKIMKSAEKATAVLIGCGLGVNENTRKLVKKLLLNINCPIILDADGINCITDGIDIIRQTKHRLILTPHPGEMARLCGITAAQVQSDRLGCAKSFAQKYDCTLVLKGASTVVAYPQRTYVCHYGNPGMSKGGSGDVLSGIVSAFAAQGIPAEAGVYIHSKAGDSAAEKHTMTSMLPSDIIDELQCLFSDTLLRWTDSGLDDRWSMPAAVNK